MGCLAIAELASADRDVARELFRIKAYRTCGQVEGYSCDTVEGLAVTLTLSGGASTIIGHDIVRSAALKALSIFREMNKERAVAEKYTTGWGYPNPNSRVSPELCEGE